MLERRYLAIAALASKQTSGTCTCMYMHPQYCRDFPHVCPTYHVLNRAASGHTEKLLDVEYWTEVIYCVHVYSSTCSLPVEKEFISASFKLEMGRDGTDVQVAGLRQYAVYMCVENSYLYCLLGNPTVFFHARELVIHICPSFHSNI